jgi:hypothetical protein
VPRYEVISTRGPIPSTCRSPIAYPLLDADPCDSFADYTKMFNANVTTPAKAVVCPLDAHDVSK